MISEGDSARQSFITDLGTMVFDTLGEHWHESRLDPDSPDGVELRKAALAAMNADGDTGVTVSRRGLAQIILEHLMGFSSFDAVKAASRAHEEARIKT